MIEISALWPWALIFCVEFLWMKISDQRHLSLRENLWIPCATLWLQNSKPKMALCTESCKTFCKHKMVHRSIYNIYTVHLFTKCRPKGQVCTIQECVCVCVVHTRPTFVHASFPRCWSPTNSFQAPLLAP